MSKLVNCPNCLGSGEEINFEGTKVQKCSTCKGDGFVTPETEQTYLNKLKIRLDEGEEDIY